MPYSFEMIIQELSGLDALLTNGEMINMVDSTPSRKRQRFAQTIHCTNTIIILLVSVMMHVSIIVF